MYRPKSNFNVPMKILTPTWTKEQGVRRKVYPLDGDLIFGNFKTYGGIVNHEKTANGIFVIEDTAEIETWFRPDIKSDCAVMLEDGSVYEIINEPENIEKRNQFMKFRVRRLKGNA